MHVAESWILLQLPSKIFLWKVKEMPHIGSGRSWNFVTFLSDHEILYCVSFPKLRGQRSSCDPYFMVVMGTR